MTKFFFRLYLLLWFTLKSETFQLKKILFSCPFVTLKSYFDPKLTWKGQVKSYDASGSFFSTKRWLWMILKRSEFFFLKSTFSNWLWYLNEKQTKILTLLVNFIVENKQNLYWKWKKKKISFYWKRLKWNTRFACVLFVFHPLHIWDELRYFYILILLKWGCFLHFYFLTVSFFIFFRLLVSDSFFHFHFQVSRSVHLFT